MINDHFKLKGVSEKAARLIQPIKKLSIIQQCVRQRFLNKQKLQAKKSLENAVQELGLPFVIKPRSKDLEVGMLD